MTLKDYLKKLNDAGFMARFLWAARELGAKRCVKCYAIYGKDAALLTSIVIREYDEDGVGIYFCSETLRIEDDIARLKDIAAARAVEVKAHG